MKRSIGLLSVFLLCSTRLFSQDEFHIAPSGNFNDIKQQADLFFAGRANDSALKNGEVEDNDYLRYKRWEWYWSTRVMPDGSFPDLAAQGSIYRDLNAAAASQRLSSSVQNTSLQWTNISQTYGDGGYSGMGRATSIAFDPNDSNTFFVGAPIGGIWKTTDGGQTYTPLGDSLPYVSVGTIAVDHRNPNNIFITVGDNMGWWNYGLGVYRSTDGGVTWSPSLSSNFISGISYYRMAMSPQAPDTILVAASDGLHRTTDGGNTWNIVHTGGFRDVCFRPGDGSVVYAASDDYWGYSEVYRSLDAGATWTQISSFNQNYNYLHLSTTPADPDRLGISCDYSGTMSYYVSIDTGSTINYRAPLPATSMLFLSPTDTSIVYVGGVDVQVSGDGGTTWTQLTNWYNDGVHPTVHADQHFAAFNPVNGCCYFCNDGGLFRLRESTETWTELNDGFVTTQFYRIAVSQMNPVFMIGGTQDNGGRKRIGINQWAATNGGDAMDNAIDETNDLTIYTTYVSGLLYRSYDQWNFDTYNDITPAGSTGSWVTPYVLDPNDQSRIIAGYQDVYASPDQGATWTQLSTNLTGASTSTLSCIAVAKANSNVIYTTIDSKVFATNDFGQTWNTHLTPLGNSNFTSITSIAVFPGTTDTVYITAGGYTANKKVYRSINGGASWTNISGSLPNVPVNCCIFNRASYFHDLYIGTDVGVFMMNDTMSTWMYYGTGMPNTSVTDLEIQYAAGKLRAATYGRGIWEIDIDGTTGISSAVTDAQGNEFSLVMNPVTDQLLMDAHISADQHSVFRIYDVSGQLVLTKEQHTPVGNYQLAFDVHELSPGMYFLGVENAEGVSRVFRFIKE
ncbi:MAG TPA: T9SS type A sorting domain-containing protein [Bacteroidia bacterium]|nr:T9SS type A sorting domain-containing protein [Bacteroidia bacterium]